MIKRVADEQRQRRVAAPALTPGKVLGEAAQPRVADLAAAVVAPPASPAPVPASPQTIGVPEAVSADAAVTACVKGHRFARMPDHPTVDGMLACPHCMVKTLGDYRKIFAAIVRPVRYD